MFIALIFIVVGYIKAAHQCPARKIEYRYVPRTFIEDSQEPVSVTDIFAKMFYETTPWITSMGTGLGPPTQQQTDINKLMVSQS